MKNDKKDALSINSIKLLEPNLEFLNTSDKTKILAKNLDLEIKKISNSKAGFKIEKTNLNKPNILFLIIVLFFITLYPWILIGFFSESIELIPDTRTFPKRYIFDLPVSFDSPNTSHESFTEKSPLIIQKS